MRRIHPLLLAALLAVAVLGVVTKLGHGPFAVGEDPADAPLPKVQMTGVLEEKYGRAQGTAIRRLMVEMTRFELSDSDTDPERVSPAELTQTCGFVKGDDPFRTALRQECHLHTSLTSANGEQFGRECRASFIACERAMTAAASIIGSVIVQKRARAAALRAEFAPSPCRKALLPRSADIRQYARASNLLIDLLNALVAQDAAGVERAWDAIERAHEQGEASRDKATAEAAARIAQITSACPISADKRP